MSERSAETWLPVVDYAGLYEVSDLGRVRSVVRRKRSYPGLILKPGLMTSGYLFVILCDANGQRPVGVHRIVAAAFIRRPLPGEHANHIDGVKTNNALENLAWVTPSENQRHAHRTGLKVAPGTRGEAIGSAKLTPEKVRELRRLAPTMSQSALARYFGVSRRQAVRVSGSASWAHIA